MKTRPVMDAPCVAKSSVVAVAVARSPSACAAVALVGLLTITSSACAGLSQRVDRALLHDVPNEELLLLFDAENAVYVARDEADLARRTYDDARNALERARAYRDVIAQRRQSGAKVDSPAVLDLLNRWNDARIQMRERELDLRGEEMRTGDVRLWAARARYEGEKARLVKDKNPVGGANLELRAFEEQMKEWSGREAEAQKSVDERGAAVVQARASYFALSRQLQDESKGAYGGPWADLLD